MPSIDPSMKETSDLSFSRRLLVPMPTAVNSGEPSWENVLEPPSSLSKSVTTSGESSSSSSESSSDSDCMYISFYNLMI